MKNILVIICIGFALSLCNLSSRFKGKSTGSSSGSGSSSSSDAGGATAEHGTPTAAQAAAIAGGQEVKWEQQGMTWTVPASWKQHEKESLSFVWSAPGSSANLIVSISPMGETFPTDASINAWYDQAKTRAKNGEVDELKWVEIDGLKGVQFREANPEKPDTSRRLQWLAYRKFAGQIQFINVMLASNGKEFDSHKDEMYGILYSTKVVH
jgi:hypothetical protein